MTNRLLAHLLSAPPFIPELHTDDCDDTSCVRCVPGDLSSFLAGLSGGDLPADAVREERCLRKPIGCGKPLISESGQARVFWDEAEAARYQAEWQITGLCPDCQDRLDDADHDEPQVPMCIRCGATAGPLKPTGDRYPSGAQKFVCSVDCTEATS